ncbi:LysM peptidoglycan-binding domain-containing protein, partial [Erwinia persicina]|uniref:LysM peptidoglycan-binding domain-containing protein n=1 Tax=Erwinia persicina TaxID=55211 RepID=UPI001386E5DE
MNIITQIAFPLAGTFTPMIAGAGSDRHFLESTDSSAPMPTKVYTLSSGESTESVAKKYNIPLSALRQLNQLGVLRRNPRFFRLPKLYRGFILRLGNKFTNFTDD